MIQESVLGGFKALERLDLVFCEFFMMHWGTPWCF